LTSDTGSGKRILLVEDDAISLKLMKDALEAAGYAVEQTTTGLDALEMARRLAPDLIVMDIGLPGMNGVDVTRRLKAERHEHAVPILAVTAYAMPGDEERMRSAGCDAYLTKPLRFAQFVAVVNRLLEPDSGS
jgi:two-component system cell cycle response regulator DivK